MKHLHEKSGKHFEIGRLMDFDGKTFDINVITKWDEENDFEQSPIIVGYYFGEYDKSVTDDYIDMFLEQQKTLKSSLKFLENKLLIDEQYMEQEQVDELKNTIKSVTEMITDLV